MSKSSAAKLPFVVGWEEWLALPDLGLPAIRAKIDTGAKTSSLHAFEIETFGPAAKPSVRFGIHPIPGREDIARYGTATIVDRRDVTSSNGERETRFVIRTRLVLAGRDWGEIELTLANRESMAYRMLLGRQAIRGGMLVDPAASFLQPRLSHKLYAGLPKQDRPVRHLRIALIATRPTRKSNMMLQTDAESRGHALDILPLDKLAFDFCASGTPLMFGGEPAENYDSVIARTTGGMPGLAAAVVQHLQRSGATTLNDAGAIERLRNPYLVALQLQACGIRNTLTTNDASEIRVLVLLGKAVAVQGHATVAAKRLALKVAGALGLGMVAVAFAGDGSEIRIVGIDPNPPLTGFNHPSTLAREIITAVETRASMPSVQPLVADGDA